MTQEFLDIAIGAISPLLVSWLKDCKWPDWAKVLFTLGISVLIAVGNTVLLGNTLSVEALQNSTGRIFTTAVIVYKAYFQGTVQNRDLEAATPLSR